MVSSRDTGDVAHARFRDLPQFLRRGDLLVLNTTATLPAALRARRENGEEIALHYSTSLPGELAVVEPRYEAHPEGLSLPGGAFARLLVPYRNSKRLWIAQLTLGLPLLEYRSEEHTSELQSQSNLVCRLLLEKKRKRRLQ